MNQKEITICFKKNTINYLSSLIEVIEVIINTTETHKEVIDTFKIQIIKLDMKETDPNLKETVIIFQDHTMRI